MQIGPSIQTSPTVTYQNNAVRASKGKNDQNGTAFVDFHAVSAKEMRATAFDLFKAGKVDIDQLLILQWGSEARISTDGSIHPQNDADDKPIDFIALVEKGVRAMEATGEARAPKSPYASWVGALEALRSLQGSVNRKV